MNPALDQLLVAALIIGAVGFFVLRFIRKRRARKAGCASDCGCAPAAKPGGELGSRKVL